MHTLLVRDCNSFALKKLFLRPVHAVAFLSGKWYRRFCLILAMSFFSSLCWSQEITVDFKETSLSKILNEVKVQSKHDVFYNQALLRNIKNITIKAEKEPLQKFLDRLFADLPVNYSIANNTIVVMPKAAEKSPVANANFMAAIAGGDDVVVKGRVVDYKNKPLSGVMVQFDQSYFYTTTNAQGDFTINGSRGGMITFSAQGFADLETRYDGEGFLLIQMEPLGSNLQNVMVASVANKRDPTVHIDLTNRSYMNLSQVLQGTIPGVSLQTVNTSTTTISTIQTRINQFGGFVTFTPDQFLRAYPTNGQEIMDALISGIYPSWMNRDLYRFTTTTRVTSTLIPQLRGANAFTGNLAGMLVVIDGFARDGFPADFPMNNVESIEIVKDPAELVKWGARANGGIIMIKTKQGKSGELQVNYSANLYYSPARRFSREKLQLANTKDVLDYTLQADSLFGLNANNANNLFNVAYPDYLLRRLRNNIITRDQFNKQWDSLGNLDNEQQLRLLQQNAFNHNHNLTLVGGTRGYRFSLMGGFSSSQDQALNGGSKNVTLNMNNTFNLLDDRLNLNLYFFVNNVRTRSGAAFNPSSLGIQPYQMLLGNDGAYAYDYTLLNPDANALLLRNGYYDYGVNLLEDATVNKFINNSRQAQARMNLSWKLLPGLTWAASVYVSNNNNANENLYNKQSSYARQQVNLYGERTPGGINFYVPWGDIRQRSESVNREWNVRSGLGYTKTIGKNEFSLNIGAGAASMTQRQPAAVVQYAYNADTKSGAPVYLPTPDPRAAITNFYTLFSGQGSSAYPYFLTVPINLLNTNNRNVNWNANASYKYDERFTLSGMYNSVYSPNYGQEVYSQMSNYVLNASYDIFRKPVTKWLDNVSVSSGVTGNKLPNLPVNYNASRYQQLPWGNYAVWVNNYSPTQQLGQGSRNISQSLKLSLLKGRYELTGTYNTQRMNGINSRSVTDLSGKTVNTATDIHYVSAAAKANLRNGLLTMEGSYSKSPEGQSQVNASAKYNIVKESYFHSKNISTLEVDGVIQNISPYQGLGLMMGTNVSSNGSYSTATNSSFNILPPKNTNYEARARMGLQEDKYLLDVRYYNRTTSGLNNNIAGVADVSSGLGSQVSYSSIVNKGVEFFLKTAVVQRTRFSYSITLNGSYNVNMAKNVPVTAFRGTDQYATAYRDGYNTFNVWSYNWAGLDPLGNPQIYDAKGGVTSVLDSATLASSMVYSGVLRSPWNGGFIHDVTFGQFFGRVTFTFSMGAVMRRYIPTPSSEAPVSSLVRERWKKAGDELLTDVPAMTNQGEQTYRGFVTRNSSNSIMSADYVRVQEIMFGYRLSQATLKYLKLNSAFITFQVQNAAMWTRNKYRLDPASVSSNGRIGMPMPVQYSCTVNVGF